MASCENKVDNEATVNFLISKEESLSKVEVVLSYGS
jgi:hypothetical protein